jgi:hypothetical protein
VRIAAGVIGALGAVSTLFVGVIFIFAATLAIGIARGVPTDHDVELFRRGGLIVVASAIALAFSVTLLCSRIKQASSLVLIAAGVVGLFCQGWTAGALILAGSLGFAAARSHRVQPAA